MNADHSNRSCKGAPLLGAPLLGARSWYSLLDGAMSPEDLCARAAGGGWSSLALTDTENLYALPAFVDAARSAGIKPIAGARFEPEGGGAFRVYCMDARGFARLCAVIGSELAVKVPQRRLGSRRVPEPDPEDRDGEPEGEGFAEFAAAGAAGGPRADAGPSPHAGALAAFVEQGWEGLALSSGDPGILSALAASPARPERPSLFAAVSPGAAQERTAASAARLGIPLLAEHPAMFSSEADRRRWRLLRAVSERKTLSELRAEPGPEADFLHASDAGALLSAFPAAIRASRALAESAESAESFLSETPVFPPYGNMSDAQAFDLLGRLCREGSSRRYGVQPDASAPPGSPARRIHDRLAKELRIIGAKGFASYFLVVRDIVQRCPRTCGRGSAASSIVSYLLGLTHVEPLSHDLFFERFLNEGRKDPPDIDIDFPWDERPALLASVFSQYSGRSAMVADHCTFSVRGSVREAALALGMTAEEVRRAGKALRLGSGGGSQGSRGSQGPGRPPRSGADASASQADLPTPLREAAALLYGVPRYIGTHPGGVVITPGPISAHTHVQPSPSGIPVLAWEKDGTERAGLIKIDLLGNRSLAVLRDCLTLVNAGAAKPLPWDFDPFADGRARMLLESGDTMGIFYVESPATRRLLRKMGVADYGHLVAASSIIRPAANRYIDEYVRRLRGSSWKRLPESVETTLGETFGIMVYQEDVARVAMAAAGFSAAEADGLRKALAKRRSGTRLEDFRARLMEGCAGRGIEASDAEAVWDMMKSFEGYSFCKAHSASYALVSYRLAWMKARHPAVFMASVINNGGGFYGTQAYLGEARRMGITVLPPHVNSSGGEYRVERPAGAMGAEALRVGMSQVRDLSGSLVARLAAGLTGPTGPWRPWPDLETLFRSARPSALELRALVRSGCLDGLPAVQGGSPMTRPSALWYLHQLRAHPPVSGVGTRELLAAPPEAPSFMRDYRPGELLADEVRFLGVLASSLPSTLYRRRAEDRVRKHALPSLIPPSSMRHLAGSSASMTGTLIASKTVAASTGKPMAFVTLEGEEGIFDIVLFPEAYAAALPVLESHHAFLASGLVKEEFGVPCLQVRVLEGLNRAGFGGTAAERTSADTGAFA